MAKCLVVEGGRPVERENIRKVTYGLASLTTDLGVLLRNFDQQGHEDKKFLL